jgi:hypothetical protein
MRIKGFMHQTSPEFAIEMMKSGKLVSGARLGQKSTYHDNTFVYLTPVDGEGIPIPYTDVGKYDVYLQFKPSLIEAYPKFFINTSQSQGPGDGQMDPVSKKCRCRTTYNTISSVEGPCVKKTLEEIDAALRFDLEYCDAGPEIGFPDEINLLPHLMNISMLSETYERVKDQIPPEYASYITFVGKGGKRRKTRRRKMSRKYCKKTPCKKMGFTQRASCRPWKNCYKNKK